MSAADGLFLRPLRPSDEPAARRAHEELTADGFVFLFDLDATTSFEVYLQHLERQRTGTGLPPGRVPWTFLVAEAEGELVGRVSLRHELNATLRKEGGHVGYAVRPAFRRRGYGTRMLELSIEHLRGELGIGAVLVTCDDTNLASAAVIERCGGVLEGVDPPWPGAVPVRRYWIE